MNEKLAFEVDFHPVGDGEKGGDAITIQYGKLNSCNEFVEKKVIVIDGGTLASGKKIVEHIKAFYKTTKVDLVVNTHPDNDHCSGLRVVINELLVKEIWMHQPWISSNDFLELFKDGRITCNSLKERLKDALNVVSEIEGLARSKNIKLKEPFAGLTFDDGVITILGPTKNFYKELLPAFRSTPEPVNESFSANIFSMGKDIIQMEDETMEVETLDASGQTSPENNSSVISLFSYAENKFLFTGDAGIPALQQAIYFASKKQIALDNLSCLQVPHHGSKRNICPDILNSIKAKRAYISCPKQGDPKHPSKKVTNALNRRGVSVLQTKGKILCNRFNTQMREGYASATLIPFYNQVEK